MVKIISDSTCDLTRELLERYQVTVLPLHVLLGDTEYLVIFIILFDDCLNLLV